MAKDKKKRAARPRDKAVALPSPSLAPRVLEEAAQGWLQSSGAAPRAPRPSSSQTDQRLTQALTETLQELRSEITELRARMDRLETR